MDHQHLMQDMVNGYRTYAEPVDLNLTATTEAPAVTPQTSTPECHLIDIFAHAVADNFRAHPVSVIGTFNNPLISKHVAR